LVDPGTFCGAFRSFLGRYVARETETFALVGIVTVNLIPKALDPKYCWTRGTRRDKGADLQKKKAEMDGNLKLGGRCKDMFLDTRSR
jgi:hypothetical protein